MEMGELQFSEQNWSKPLAHQTKTGKVLPPQEQQLGCQPGEPLRSEPLRSLGRWDHQDTTLPSLQLSLDKPWTPCPRHLKGKGMLKAGCRVASWHPESTWGAMTNGCWW